MRADGSHPQLASASGLGLAQEHLIRSPVYLPRVDNVGIRDGGEVIRLGLGKQAAVWVEVQNTGGGLPAGGRYPVLDGRDRTARTPHVVDDQDPAADDLLVFGELDELGPGEELGFLAAVLEGEIDGRRQDMRQTEELAEHAPGDDPAPGDDHHRLVFTLELRK